MALGCPTPEAGRKDAMPAKGIPSAFWLLVVFGLLAAGIVALAGFAIEKSDDKDDNVAASGANAAILERVESGELSIADLDPTDPVRIRLEAEGVEVSEEPEPEAPDGAGQPPSGEPDPAAGEATFFANGCNACHGDQGQGGLGPTIAQTGFSVEQVINQYRSPRDLMPPLDASIVPDDQVANIHAWLRTLPLPDTIVPGEGTP